MARKGRKLFFCRLHEVEHLRPTPEIEEMNVRRLGGSIKDVNGCWVWIGGVQGKYGAFVPEGANQVAWMAHRVIWDLLMVGHRPRYELDHDFCRNPPCVNPSHLEPVLRSENERHKRRPKRNINWPAAESPAVRAFAERFGLSLPPRPRKTL
jgi:hypothetical protein